MPFKIVRNDITRMNTEAIVNTASDRVAVGPGCDSAVYKAAGHGELLRYRKENIGPVEEGNVFITPGFRLQAKYIIHAVSPLFRGGDSREEEKLRSCYRKSLQLAKEKGIRSIAFPLISTGSYGYPKEEGMRIAVDEIHAFLLGNEMMIYLVVFDPVSTGLGSKIYPGLETYIDQKYIENAGEEEYGYGVFFSEPRAPGNLAAEGKLRTPGKPAAEGAPRASEKRSPCSAPLTSGRPSRRAARKSSAPSQGSKGRSSAGKKFDFSPDEEVFEEESFKEEHFEAEYFEAELFEREQDVDFTGRHESRLEERMKHLTDTFSEYLMYLIREKGMENAEVWRRAIVDKKVFSKIKNNPDYHPNKLTALCLCIGAKLNLDEARDLLARAGYALSPCDKTDIIFSYFIENGIYDMIELDIQLEEHGLPCIIT